MRTAVNICVVLTCLIALANENSPAPISTAVDVRAEDLLVQPPASNWISYNGDYSGRRYSSLAEINSTNVAQLKAWRGLYLDPSSASDAAVSGTVH